MFFWFIGMSVLTIWFVFTDPQFDYRLLCVGSVLPGLTEVPFRAAGPWHSLAVSAVLLAATVLGTKRHSARRKLILGLPLGVLLHLTFTGAWLNAATFWWPGFGFGIYQEPHPILARAWWNIPLEIVGIAICVWVYNTAELDSPQRRREFWQAGRLHLPVR